jgi:hypothetical protein
MKSKIFAAMLLLVATATSSFSLGNDSNFPGIREVRIAKPFQKLIVNNNVELVIVQDESKSIIAITGSEKNVENVDLIFSDDKLTITSKKNTEGVVIYIPITNLSLVKLASGAAVSGEGDLKFDNLTVILDTESYVNLKAAGNVTLKPADNCDIIYEKNKRYKVNG